jgi:predicted dehydrogenase/NADPH:quinone reductase-like Zn-dependent oxidoreductase
MKVLLHRLDGGPSSHEEVPTPRAGATRVVVETRATLVSAGTERTIVEFGRGSMLAKARQQPAKVRQVLDKARTEGVAATIDAVRSKLAEPVALGYCHAGIVVDDHVASRYAPGTRVVTNGPHAEYVAVPHNLAARIPEGVPFDVAAFTPLAAIGLQGIRMAAPTLGETVVVYGLGLIGLLTVQLLRASGCRVLGVDTNDARLALARQFGADVLDARGGDVTATVLALTGGVGADAVLLTLAADSDEPVHNAAAMSRKRGRIVLVGVTGLSLRRDDFYAKELSFAVSCSYGPGRYDPSYEDEGHDYPIGFVRWTEQRNFDAVLRLMADGALDPRPLISHRFPFDAAPAAYDLLTSPEPSLGIVLDYPDRGGATPTGADRVRDVKAAPAAATPYSVGVVGAGSFGSRVLIPALAASGARLRAVASSRGTSAAVAARRHGFERVATDLGALFDDPAVDTVAILTRHDSHADLALRALRAGKHVFVEKPLALTDGHLDELEAEVARGGRLLTVGFNRRFAPLARAMRAQLSRRAGPASLVLTVNAGAVPREHWVHSPAAGGGRIAGEACHFIDLARFLVGSPIRALTTVPAVGRDGAAVDDVAHLTIAFADGSTAVVHYLANGSPAFPKERVEAFADGRVWQIDNWRRLRAWGGGTAAGGMLSRPDKGHADELRAFAAAVRAGGPPPIPYDELFEVSRWTLRAAEAARRPPTA